MRMRNQMDRDKSQKPDRSENTDALWSSQDGGNYFCELKYSIQHVLPQMLAQITTAFNFDMWRKVFKVEKFDRSAPRGGMLCVSSLESRRGAVVTTVGFGGIFVAVSHCCGSALVRTRGDMPLKNRERLKQELCMSHRRYYINAL